MCDFGILHSSKASKSRSQSHIEALQGAFNNRGPHFKNYICRSILIKQSKMFPISALLMWRRALFLSWKGALLWMDDPQREIFKRHNCLLGSKVKYTQGYFKCLMSTSHDFCFCWILMVTDSFNRASLILHSIFQLYPKYSIVIIRLN